MANLPSDVTKNNRNVAIYYVIRGIRGGESGASILRSLRANGLGYRTQDFYSDYNYYTDNPTRLPGLTRNQRQWYLPVEGEVNYPTSKTNRYQYIFDVTGINNATGEGDTRRLSLVSVTKLSPYEAFSRLQDVVDFGASGISINQDESQYITTRYYDSSF